MTTNANIARVLVIGAIAGIASSAGAQYRVDESNLLQRPLQRPLQQPLQVYPNYGPSATDMFLQSLRFREAIVTGNAPGGLSFRGDLPYSGAGDFRGDLGANDLFAFRRDSLGSGLGGLGIRGSDALQAQYSLSIGARAPSGLIGVGAIDRFGGGAPISGAAPIRRVDPTAPPAGEAPGFTRPFGADPLDPSAPYRAAQGAGPDISGGFTGGGLGGVLRSTSMYSTSIGDRASILAAFDTESGIRVGLTASPNDGLRYVPLAETMGGAQTGSRAAPSGASSGAIDTRAPGSGPVRTEAPTTLDELGVRLRNAPMLPGETDRWPELTREIQRRLLTDRLDEGGETAGFDPEITRRLRDLIGPLETFTSGDIARMERGALLEQPAFMQELAMGEALLREGRYFDAEERLTRALVDRPGDASAQLARVNAQIGAGLLTSASVNLRLLIAQNPEVLAVTLDPSLMPGEQRVDQIINAMRSSGSVGRNALLQAYLGRQLGLDSMRDEGIEMLDRSPSEADRALAELLRSVWLDGRRPSAPEAEIAPDTGSAGDGSVTPP